MAYLRLMGGYLFLKKKDGKHSLMDSFSLVIDDIDHVDEIQINGLNFDYDYPKFLLCLEDYYFNGEKCKSISEFLVLTNCILIKNVISRNDSLEKNLKLLIVQH